jgi:hypothetical protein
MWKASRLYYVAGGTSILGESRGSHGGHWFRPWNPTRNSWDNFLVCTSLRHAKRQFARLRKNCGVQIDVRERGKKPYVLIWK